MVTIDFFIEKQRWNLRPWVFLWKRPLWLREDFAGVSVEKGISFWRGL
jgi:hypothetical protein